MAKLTLINDDKDDSRETLREKDVNFISKFKDSDLNARNRIIYMMDEYMKDNEDRYEYVTKVYY